MTEGGEEMEMDDMSESSFQQPEEDTPRGLLKILFLMIIQNITLREIVTNY
jgi:hypothetical protein